MLLKSKGSKEALTVLIVIHIIHFEGVERSLNSFTHNFLSIQRIFNPQKVLKSWDLDLSNHAIQCYVCRRGWKLFRLSTPSTCCNIHMSQLLRVDPSALASSPPAIGWRPASRGRPGATRDGCDLYTFILWAGSTRRDREGGSCSVLYSDLLRAVGTPVPGEMINGASHYGGSPLMLLNKRFANGRQGARRATWTAAREWN